MIFIRFSVFQPLSLNIFVFSCSRSILHMITLTIEKKKWTKMLKNMTLTQVC